jgi:deoxyribose-phosphate aldolase
MNGGALVSGDDQLVLEDMLSVIEMAHAALAAAGVIIEAAPLTDEQVRRACRIAERAGADYVVTSTGDSSAKGAIARAALERDSLGPRISVVAAGVFLNAEEIVEALDAGARRVSCALSPGLAADALAALGGQTPMAAVAAR